MTKPLPAGKATFRVGSNIAFIKYWGVSDPQLNIPLNSSISMTLADAYTVTTVAWDQDGQLAQDEIILDGERLPEPAAQRIVDHLDRIRRMAAVSYRARVASRNNFPMASGIASSASGFAALTIAACTALGLDFDATRLSAIARRGSGSASRSLFGGFVEWEKGQDDASSVARQLFPADHWALMDVVAVVSSAHKAVSSARGHLLATTSPLLEGRMSHVNDWLLTVRDAIARRDLASLGPILELDALAMHAIMMTSMPSLLYWEPTTIEILHAVQRWREQEGIAAYFTIDAGPNVHLICEPDAVNPVRHGLAEIPGVQQVLISRPGPGPQQLEEHLI
jgi:diphosphomevalonate decarboxylase